MTYEKFDDGLWFPVSYGGEFHVRAVFFYARNMSISHGEQRLHARESIEQDRVRYEWEVTVLEMPRPGAIGGVRIGFREPGPAASGHGLQYRLALAARPGGGRRTGAGRVSIAAPAPGGVGIARACAVLAAPGDHESRAG